VKNQILNTDSMPIKYIYSENGLQESIVVPIDFWNDMLKRFNLKEHLKSENYFVKKYSELLSNLHVSDSAKPKNDDIFSLFGSWQSEKNGTELSQEIFNDRNDAPSDILL